MTEASTVSTPETRLLFLGEQALAEGFGLIGFDTWPNANADDLDRLLEALINERRNAFIVIDHELARSASRLLPIVYAEGGHILVAEVPPLSAPDDFFLDIDAQVQSLMGGRSLDD